MALHGLYKVSFSVVVALLGFSCGYPFRLVSLTWSELSSGAFVFHSPYINPIPSKVI